MNEDILLLTGASLGIGLAIVVELLFKFWQRTQEDRFRSEALAVLKKHGMSPQLYMASFGVEDHELRRAMDEFAYAGHVIIDAKGAVVGQIVPPAAKSPHLRLVISND